MGAWPDDADRQAPASAQDEGGVAYADSGDFTLYTTGTSPGFQPQFGETGARGGTLRPSNKRLIDSPGTFAKMTARKNRTRGIMKTLAFMWAAILTLGAGELAAGRAGEPTPQSVLATMKKVADWRTSKYANTIFTEPSRLSTIGHG